MRYFLEKREKAMPNPIVVEVFTASGCSHCLQAQVQVQSVVSEFSGDEVCYRSVNVVDELDYAVQLGILNTPAVAIDGTLVFAAQASAKKLHIAINARLQAVRRA